MAFLTLFRIATGDNWNGIMKDTLRDECDDTDDCLENCCINQVSIYSWINDSQIVERQSPDFCSTLFCCLRAAGAVRPGERGGGRPHEAPGGDTQAGQQAASSAITVFSSR